MSKLRKTRNQIVKLTLIFSMVLIIVSVIFLQDKIFIVYGLIFGTLTSILNFLELEKTLIKASRMKPRNAQSYVTKHYFLRYIITGIVLLISMKASYINTFGTVTGLLLLKFVIMITNLFNDKEYFKRIFRKEG
ncbi:MAG: ATP synthase subunit I [Bacillota bacterium]|nr:ATP synthase subunit I [Bacillota bacterium]